MQLPLHTWLAAAILVIAISPCAGRRKRDGRSKERKPMAPQWKKGSPRNSQVAVREATRFTLQCAIKGRPTPTFSWTRNGRSITPETDDTYRQKKGRLYVSGVQMEEMGTKYTCTAKNKHGRLEFTYSLRVLENQPLQDIDIVDRPENQTAHVGDTVIFLCRSEDFPRPQVYWARRTDSQGIMEVIQHASNKSDVLVLHNVTKGDTGAYICYINNKVANMQLPAWLSVITEDERLPFEPPCGLHVRREVYVDLETGCRSHKPLEMHYCMGSCGRSYSVPNVVFAGSGAAHTDFLTQTCRCCKGVVREMRIFDLECPLGQTKTAMFTLLKECECQECVGNSGATSEDLQKIADKS